MTTAISLKYNDIIKLMLKNRSLVNVDHLNVDNITPLIIAAEYNNYEIVKLLLLLNADPDIKDNDRRTASTIT